MTPSPRPRRVPFALAAAATITALT
ncbi:MAG: hypothetical protein K0R68_1652, partial [Mycobacterium sp.]|nr:hypothetical protein [Mycobacterium sp.]